MLKDKKGFTLIELLVVIAIIGILSSVVLASLNSARNKGADAAIKSGLANMRAQAELYYDSNSGYAGANTALASGAGVCGANTAANGISDMVASVLKTAGTGTGCYASTTAWAASAPLKAGGAYCVDSTGVATTTGGTTPATTGKCI